MASFSVTVRLEGRVSFAFMKLDAAEALRVMIEPHLSECCLYKLQHVRPAIPRGTHMRKLTDEQVCQLREQASEGVKQIDLASAFGVTQAAVSRIVRGEVYQDV
jgi:hypothetical protein